MAKVVSTNIQFPENIWKALKFRAAQESKSLKDIVIEGVLKVLNSTPPESSKKGANTLLLQYSGKIKSKIKDGSVNHDKYLYENV